MQTFSAGELSRLASQGSLSQSYKELFPTCVLALCVKHGIIRDEKIFRICVCSFLPVPDSSIGDLVNDSLSVFVDTTKENPERLVTLDLCYQSDEET